MTATFDENRDLSVGRVIRAPRSAVWDAWADPRRFEQWWVPAPGRCRVLEWELRPGGSFVTEYSEAEAEGEGEGGDDAPFGPHMQACFLVVEPLQRIVFTTCLVGGFRPATTPFITSEVTLAEHPEGTDYRAVAMHRSAEDRALHEELGFADGWGTVIRQLAELVEP